MENKKQISIDPTSPKQPSKTDESHFSMITTTPFTPKQLMLLPRFISSILPCSATSSPTKNLKTGRNQSHQSSLPITSLSRQKSAALSHLVRHKREVLRRSKSCGEGRASAPSDELDIYPRKPSNLPPEKLENEWFEHGNEVHGDNSENFKCGVLCLFLYGFAGKRKRMKSKRQSDDHRVGEENAANSSAVSLERFECGSQYSSAIPNDDEEGDGSRQLYFDLPLEVIWTSGRDTFSPVTSAFVFKSNHHLKGVLKKNPSTKSLQEPTRHVRFSVSSSASSSSSFPWACITSQAREDFYAYLEEAQRA